MVGAQKLLLHPSTYSVGCLRREKKVRGEKSPDRSNTQAEAKLRRRHRKKAGRYATMYWKPTQKDIGRCDASFERLTYNGNNDAGKQT